MKKLAFNLFLALSTLLVLGACSETEPDGIMTEPNYVSRYLVPNSISTIHCSLDNDSVQALDSNMVLRIEIVGDETDAEFYSKKFGDRSYNRYPEFTTIALTQAMNSIDITCDQAYDAEHPAGTSLSDLLVYQVFSYATVIANNYICSPPYWAFHDDNEDREYLNWNDEYRLHDFYQADVISTPLDEFNQTSHILINPISHIKFLKKPTTKGTLTFNVEIQFEEGTTPMHTTFTSVYE